MTKACRVNDMVIRFANVNGTGSASANDLFSKAIFRMGIPLSSKNVFPSNIQGLPTWYEVRINENGFLGYCDGVDIMVAVNPQSFTRDVASVNKGGYFVYDSTKKLHPDLIREDIHYIGIPMMQLCMENYETPRQHQLFKNIVYVGALAALLRVELEVIRQIIHELFSKKEKLIPPNVKALELGANYALEHYSEPLNVKVERRDNIKDKILIDGNSATALGAIYAGATVGAWYPITPSTSVISAFEKYCKRLRVDAETGKNKFAIIQAEDELAAIGMVIGANWNGARAFTSTSGAGISLMSEFLGLAYFAEIPLVLVNVQRGGPSTGMPTRTQQSDILICAYASHGDTKQVLLFPSTPADCFEMTAMAFDLADRLQTPVIVMSDLDLGMNNHVSPPLKWDDKRQYDLGKVLNKEQLEHMEDYGRYLDVDDDGICYRTLPGTHPTKGAFFTRGTSRDEHAKYTEDAATYVRNGERLQKKWQTTKRYVPGPAFHQPKSEHALGVVYFGTSNYSTLEAVDSLARQGIHFDVMQVKAFPFNDDVKNFFEAHEQVFVVEQNRDAQFRSLLINELGLLPNRVLSALNFDGMPITAAHILKQIIKQLPEMKPAGVNL
ncbi:MAG: 2-oxoacid:acceptor oxidoreductase subunit alpha [Cyclobacteriaceae bacterium]|nr:2-oxoacid:acceptor oxidoreductase subunit alpha [Cyclobacteriaceae bacterium]MDH5250938.1 2-oxoacid:acceptor oxidoreductase subunit alpha [Cyclobacteriaceae bacterium]